MIPKIHITIFMTISAIAIAQPIAAHDMTELAPEIQELQVAPPFTIATAYVFYGTAESYAQRAVCYQKLADTLYTTTEHYLALRKHEDFCGPVDAQSAKTRLMEHLDVGLNALRNNVPACHLDIIESTKTTLKNELESFSSMFDSIKYHYSGYEEAVRNNEEMVLLEQRLVEKVEHIASYLVLYPKREARNNEMRYYKAEKAVLKNFFAQKSVPAPLQSMYETYVRCTNFVDVYQAIADALHRAKADFLISNDCYYRHVGWRGNYELSAIITRQLSEALADYDDENDSILSSILEKVHTQGYSKSLGIADEPLLNRIDSLASKHATCARTILSNRLRAIVSHNAA